MILDFAAVFHPAGALRHVLPTVDGDVRAVHERSFLRAQIDDQSRDFLGLSQPAEWNLREDFRLENFLWNRHYHLGADVAGRDGIDRHALLRDLERERLGEAVHPSFRCSVVGMHGFTKSLALEVAKK